METLNVTSRELVSSWVGSFVEVGIQANYLVPLHHSTAMHWKNQNLHLNHFTQRTIFFFKLHKRQEIVLQIEFLCDLIKNLISSHVFKL